ncbi:hypothetical protein [Paraburkholderia aspalathi]|uniref:hypothetical protein n=1 Tax=Paraburkholderia aspalathi TaxID=1324617 RepID=UPI0038BCF622
MAVSKSRSRSTTFNCRICGRLARDTTGTGQELCSQCDGCTMIKNEISDNDLTSGELADAAARIVKLKAEAIEKGGKFD